MLPIANSMKHPEQFLGWQCPNVLNTGMIVNTLLFTSVGFLGYIRYGDNVKANIVLELPSGHVLSQVAQVLIGFAILFTFGLQFYAPFETLFTKISHKIPAKNTNLAQILIRSATCILMGCLAMAIPHLQPFIGLMGSIFLSLLGTRFETIYLFFIYGKRKVNYFRFFFLQDYLFHVL